MRKVVVYAGNRAVYRKMEVAAKSLVWNSPVDRVWLLTENAFPSPMPGKIRVMNVSGQTFFPESGPNYRSDWSYMTLMRCALAKMFPDEERVLWLDIDTIVCGDISPLFEMDMDGYCFAGVMEPGKSIDIFRYINAGVLLCNLEEIRRIGKDDELIELINRRPLVYPDQDAINLYCQGYIRTVGGEWNASDYTVRGDGRKIIHFAARNDFEDSPEFRLYDGKGWPEG